MALEDCVRLFYAGTSGVAKVKPYVESDVYTALNAMVPVDWRSFIHRHLDQTDTTELLGALERSG